MSPAELYKESDHECYEEGKTSSGTNFSNQLGEVIELDLQGRVFRVTTKGWKEEISPG